MKWEFSCEQVARGEVEYSLKAFRADYRREIRDNFEDFDADQLEAMYKLAYDVCYCCAVRKDLKSLVAHCKEKGIKVDLEYLQLIRNSNLENIEMLKAIFAKKVSELMAEGLDPEAALKKLEIYNQAVVAEQD